VKRAALFFLVLAACRQEMADMPRLDPMERAPMFDGGSAALRPPPGTVPADADLAPVPDALPREVPLALVERGRERYDIFCAPCHSPLGDGDGIIVERGFPSPPSFHDPGLIAAPDRHFYEVITHGFGVMFPYAARVPPRDRWAIIAYIRALQLAERAPVALAGPAPDPAAAEGENR
jgi:mono/diheme cytochrome c family protein